MARNRLKRNSIINFVLIAIITALGIFLSFGSFNIPFTSYTYNGFANSISYGLDLAGGVYVVYDASLADDSNTGDLDSAIDATVRRLESIITSEYSEATITRQGSTQIRVEVPSVDNIEEIFEMIGEPTPLYMTLNEGKDDSIPDSQIILGTDIQSVNASYQPDESTGENVYGVSVQFTDEGAKKFETMTDTAANGNKEMFIYFGEIDDAGADLTLTVEEKIVGGSTFISGSFETFEDAENYALQIMSGTFNAKLAVSESALISATLGAEALLLAMIGGLVGLVLIMVLLWWRYGDFGLLAAFALVIYLVLMIFFLQAIPFVQLTLPGIAGIILSIGMAVDGTVIIFEKFREEYRSGKKIPMSSKIGFKRAFWPIFDSNITTIFTAFVLYILGTSAIQGFAITLLIGILLSMFMNLVILRGFVKWYLPLNSIKPKKLHLPKQIKPTKSAEAIVVGGKE